MEPPKTIFTTIRIKRRLAGDPGPPTNMTAGELAMNEVDGTLYYKTSTPAASATNEDQSS